MRILLIDDDELFKRSKTKALEQKLITCPQEGSIILRTSEIFRLNYKI